MPRGPRLDTEGALHQVMVRGVERRKIFLSDDDRDDLLARIALIAPATGSKIYAWSLMPKHFHLLLRSGPAGLSTFMRRLQTGYAGSFNRRNRRSGHLFQNRFKSVLVEEEPYLLELVRYIHLNPVRARMVKTLRGLDAYPWSGHAAILGRRKAKWQDAGFVLEQFGRNKQRARRAYRDFMAEGFQQGKRPELSGGGLIRSVGGRDKMVEFRRGREHWVSDARVLGSGEFVEQLQEKIEAQNDKPRLSPGEREEFLSRLAMVVADAFDLRREELLGGSRIRKVVAGRYVMCAVAVSMGIPAMVVAQAVGVRIQSVLRGVERGKELMGQRGLDIERILKQCE